MLDALAADLDRLGRDEITAEELRALYPSDAVPGPVGAVLCNLSHYLADADLRARDEEYRRFQHAELAKLVAHLRAGDLTKAMAVDFLRASDPARDEDPRLADADWMRMAVAEAERAGAAGEVPVGAVVVREGRVLGAAGNAPIGDVDPTAHAEVRALRAAARAAGNYRLPGAVLYVTVEPCAMCVGAALQARIATLVFGCHDPKAGAAGSLYDLARDPRFNHRIEVVSGVDEARCRGLLQAFFAARRGPGPNDPVTGDEAPPRTAARSRDRA